MNATTDPPPPEVIALAETPHAFLDPGDLQAIDDNRFVILIGEGQDPRFRSIERPRLVDVPEDVEWVRAEFRSRGFRDATWWVGSSAAPPDLAAELRGLKMVAHDDSPLTLMALHGEPSNVPADVVAERAVTQGDLYAGWEIQNQAFGIAYTHDVVSRASKTPAPPDSTEPVVLARDSSGAPFSMGILAVADNGAFLQTAATLPSCEGRGGYRAVVGARCEIAHARGIEWVVTQAGRSSRPILEQMGFCRIGIVEVLVDCF